MNAYVLTFRLVPTHGDAYEINIPAYSVAMGWAAVAMYVAAHTCNPVIRGIELVATRNIVQGNPGLKEINAADAADYIARPRA